MKRSESIFEPMIYSEFSVLTASSLDSHDMANELRQAHGIKIRSTVTYKYIVT